ncbi:hypothetical protein QR680_012295 [Steinernema hermaphroditum]|uniref:Dynein heavy chain region D6 P-loop domain-containing protein n=1 Tax=Steinernema hermaphroditum TaxID=289476 RepID=A0AA39I1J6_9BILA|nr:hypothetical protein QR680_012295 [Steinernema hermaphroditum]
MRVKAAQSDLLTQLELAVRFGKTAIVEDVADVDPLCHFCAAKGEGTFQATIAVAGMLVERLGSEFSRWQEQMNDLQEQMDQLSRCCIVSAAFITFLGGASERIRGDTVEQWVNIINLGRSGSKGPHFNVLSFLALETEQLNWKNRGLPADALSLQNTVTLFRSVETPLVIDATGRVTDFLQRFLGDSVVRLKAAQSDLLTQLELAVRFGKTAISMGQGQQTIALETLRKCAAEGEWLCLTNLHLVTSFVPELQKTRALPLLADHGARRPNLQQLALTLALRKRFKPTVARCHAAVLMPFETQFLNSIGVETPPDSDMSTPEEGLAEDEVTLFYMPGCVCALENIVIWANRKNMRNVIFFTDRLDNYDNYSAAR